MAHPTHTKTVSNLIHITSPRNALLIARNKEFRSFNNPRHYDAGANFLSTLGEQANTQPVGRGAKLSCTWTGLVTNPLPNDAYDVHTPNILHDFNGSGAIFRNEDPRYFLPYESDGLILNSIEIQGDDQLETAWLSLQVGFFTKLFCRNPLAKARAELKELNTACASGKILLNVRRRYPE